ncbi:hypothetical protein RRG08_005455 [Elysia crispata]|uniref:Uncharacterized protein n=1 Tax=Elysia crispata TaxID=231223 RepID=A0AAE1CR69_9GAST|nr:hypothetical protein RRG08_005455 [Elysia crispata]
MFYLRAQLVIPWNLRDQHVLVLITGGGARRASLPHPSGTDFVQQELNFPLDGGLERMRNRKQRQRILARLSPSPGISNPMRECFEGVHLSLGQKATRSLELHDLDLIMHAVSPSLMVEFNFAGGTISPFTVLKTHLQRDRLSPRSASKLMVCVRPQTGLGQGGRRRWERISRGKINLQTAPSFTGSKIWK